MRIRIFLRVSRIRRIRKRRRRRRRRNLRVRMRVFGGMSFLVVILI